MYKNCRYCQFKNPPDIGECLACGRKLPTTIGEVKEAFKDLGDLASGEWGKVGERKAKGFAKEQVSSLKYRFHPLWILKVKLHRLKQSLVTTFRIFAIIAGLVIFGLLFDFFTKLVKGR